MMVDLICNNGNWHFFFFFFFKAEYVSTENEFRNYFYTFVCVWLQQKIWSNEKSITR